MARSKTARCEAILMRVQRRTSTALPSAETLLTPTSAIHTRATTRSELSAQVEPTPSKKIARTEVIVTRTKRRRSATPPQAASLQTPTSAVSTRASARSELLATPTRSVPGKKLMEELVPFIELRHKPVKEKKSHKKKLQALPAVVSLKKTPAVVSLTNMRSHKKKIVATLEAVTAPPIESKTFTVNQSTQSDAIEVVTEVSLALPITASVGTQCVLVNASTAPQATRSVQLLVPKSTCISPKTFRLNQMIFERNSKINELMQRNSVQKESLRCISQEAWDDLTLPTFERLSEVCVFKSAMDASFQRLIGGLSSTRSLLVAVNECGEAELLLKTKFTKKSWLDDISMIKEKQEKRMNHFIIDHHCPILFSLMVNELRLKMGILVSIGEHDFRRWIIAADAHVLHRRTGLSQAVWLDVFIFWKQIMRRAKELAAVL